MFDFSKLLNSRARTVDSAVYEEAVNKLVLGSKAVGDVLAGAATDDPNKRLLIVLSHISAQLMFISGQLTMLIRK